ncbi:serine/threonine-protein kinase [Kitasatospora sp. NPDC085879]|uniref:serine/threonine-protein kinase n=1 Tax=Kitasatospora sp. NPDC085879 TaxID=3154769 RepID=UPI00341C846B
MEPLGAADPARVGAYRLLGRLGAGGMGRVYLGRTAGGRTVAVKVVRGELADDPEFRARFRQEVAAARLVGGRWTAPVLDADTEGDHPWVASGYVAGPSLDAAVRRHGPLPVPAVHTLGAALAEALEQVHGLGLVHRDVKPSNVLLALDGPRLIDFGIARALDAATALTRSGYVVGSPGYLSPEQAAGEPAGPAGDVFSLGAVLAFAATGTAPFGEGVSAAVLLYRVLHEEPDLDGLTGPLYEAVRACLAKHAADRPTPAALRALLAPGASPASGDWLPSAVSAAVARSAVGLLDLEAHDPEAHDPPAVAVPPVPAGPATPVGVPHDRTPTELDRPAVRRPRRRWAAPLAVLALLAAGGGGLWFALHDSGEANGGSHDAATGRPAGPDGNNTPGPSAAGSSAPSSAAPSSATPAASGSGSLPAGYLGSWKGTIVTRLGGLPSTFRVEFTKGRVGEVVGRTSNASAFSDTVCHGELTLLTAGADRIELQERPVGSDPRCTGDPEKQTYTPSGQGALHLQVSGEALGMDPSGDLAKQG